MPANQPESCTVSLRITHGESQALLSSARELASVKLEAIEHGERIAREGSEIPAELEGHQAELADVRELVEQLERLASTRRSRPSLTGRRGLVDEIVLGALIAEGQELADSIVELQPAGDLHDITTRLAVVRRLLATLARVRSRP
jgi:hypothetical protein